MKGVADIALCGTLASMLEVAGWPKPGNVHRTSSFEPKFERFLCGAAILYTPLLKAAEAGFLAASEVKISGWKFGELLTLSYTLGLDWHREGNTNLGASGD